MYYWQHVPTQENLPERKAVSLFRIALFVNQAYYSANDPV
ncbi:hypothetical protein SAMN06269250_4603 [Spirosoma fluviale]|uniref:Uncharacterized protein n=1 Tax=Spirosoma fluviale TaxID=1597977 RepID=A0A286GHU2_9BACT|nr:hypothetical protein SAMN06269250_4603 [Spirosoma fluviale]